MELGSQEHLLTSFQGDQTLGSQCGFLSNPLSEFSLIVTILIIKISGLDGIQDGPWAEQRMSKHTFNDTLRLIRGEGVCTIQQEEAGYQQAWVQILPPVFCSGHCDSRTPLSH